MENMGKTRINGGFIMGKASINGTCSIAMSDLETHLSTLGPREGQVFNNPITLNGRKGSIPQCPSFGGEKFPSSYGIQNV